MRYNFFGTSVKGQTKPDFCYVIKPESFTAHTPNTGKQVLSRNTKFGWRLLLLLLVK